MSKYNIISTVFLVTLLGSLTLDGALTIPVQWYAGLIIAYVVIVATGVWVLSWSFFVKVRSSGSGNAVALTFDDGPLEGLTSQILEILKRYDVPAAFFCIGNRVDAHPELVRQMDEQGHLVGNHTYWHGKFFDLKSAPMVTRELYDTDVAISNVIGKKPKLFRPPYGVTNPMIAKALRRLNHTVIGWSLRSFDSVIKDPEKLYQRVTGSLKPGDIILFHDYSLSTISILPRVLEEVRKRGLKIVRVDELLNEKPYV